MKTTVFLAGVFIFSAFNVVSSSNFIKAENLFSTGGKCKIKNFSDALQNSQAVFLGKVIGEEKNGDYKNFKFKVEKYWKGKNVKTINVSVYENMSYQAFYKVGEKYLVYARNGENGKFIDEKCSRSQNAENAAEDITKLGNGRKPK